MPEHFSYQPVVRNEVDGDVSFEEVRWADYQEPNKQLVAARFAEASRLKSAQFEVSILWSFCAFATEVLWLLPWQRHAAN